MHTVPHLHVGKAQYLSNPKEVSTCCTLNLDNLTKDIHMEVLHANKCCDACNTPRIRSPISKRLREVDSPYQIDSGWILCRILQTNAGYSELDSGVMVLNWSFGALIQLSQLILTSTIPASWLRPVLGLPELERLGIVVTDSNNEDEEGANLFLESTRLTKLQVEGWDFRKLTVRTLLQDGS